MSDIEQKLREQANLAAEVLGIPTERTYQWQAADHMAQLERRLARAEMHIQPGPAWDEYQEEVEALTKAKTQPAEGPCEWVWKGNGWVASCEPYVLQTHQTKFCSSCGKWVSTALQGEK